MMIFNDTSFDNLNLRFAENAKNGGEVGWESPSNIALIKYWGKHSRQLPMNPSLSFSLKNAVTRTSVEYETSETSGINYKFFFEGKPKPKFEAKLNIFFENILPIFPFLAQIKLTINSSNTFPHSSGIASSASGMSALALCICSIEQKEFQGLKSSEDFFRKASFVARLGSGSAARSVYGGFVNWGKIDSDLYSSDYFANKYSQSTNKIFSDYKDAIILTNTESKKVSSTQGHGLMNNHPYAEARYKQARTNYLALCKALETGNMLDFAEIVENEALSLHSLMMSSKPGYFLIEPITLELLEKIRSFRKSTKIPVCFTLDAGPNIHLLYPAKSTSEVEKFISSEILIDNNKISVTFDETGSGPLLITNNRQ